MCVQIEDMEPKVFQALLHFIYTDSVPEIDDADAVGMIQHLLVAAEPQETEVDLRRQTMQLHQH